MPLENERTMCRLNDDGTITVALIRTIPQPRGPINMKFANADALEHDTCEIMRRHAAQFMFPFRRTPIDLDG